jgi:hypothetical protein
MSSHKQADNLQHQKSIVSLTESEIERLKRDIYRPDMEKLHLFTEMLRLNALYKKAKITHK